MDAGRAARDALLGVLRRAGRGPQGEGTAGRPHPGLHGSVDRGHRDTAGARPRLRLPAGRSGVEPRRESGTDGGRRDARPTLAIHGASRNQPARPDLRADDRRADLAATADVSPGADLPAAARDRGADVPTAAGDRRPDVPALAHAAAAADAATTPRRSSAPIPDSTKASRTSASGPGTDECLAAPRTDPGASRIRTTPSRRAGGCRWSFASRARTGRFTRSSPPGTRKPQRSGRGASTGWHS